MLGAGGHARVLQEALALQGVVLHGFVAPTEESQLGSCPWLGAEFDHLDPDAVLLVNGIGSISEPEARQRVYLSAVAAGFSFASVIDATAIVRPSVELAPGVQVLAGAILNTDVVIGENAIINTGAIIEHGSRIGAHSHVSPAAALAGNVTIGETSHVGIGARVIQGISVGSHCTIGAGAVVTRDVEDGSTAVGVPAVSRSTEGRTSR